MVDRIGQTGSLAREALLAALKAQAGAAREVETAARGVANPGTGGGEEAQSASSTRRPGFVDGLVKSVESLQEELDKAQSLPEDLLAGKIADFHEVAVQIKKADLTFKFAMEIRNKLIDAYREVMRMNV